jgi:hypothetical protein
LIQFSRSRRATPDAQVHRTITDIEILDTPAMNPCGFRSLSVTLLLLCAGVAIVAASGFHAPATVTRELRVAVLDARKSGTTRDLIRRTFATGIGRAIREVSGQIVQVNAVALNTNDASAAFSADRFDALLVLGGENPTAWRNAAAATFTGSLVTESGRRAVYLIVANSDRELQNMLRHAFPRLLADGHLLSATSERITLLPGGSQLAVVEP